MTSTPESTATRFVVGQSYAARSAGDYDCVWTFTVESRTAHFVTLRQDSGESMRVGVREWRGVETALPFGRYSMSPSISAERRMIEQPQSEQLAEPMEMLSAVERRCVVDLVGIIHAARGDHPALAEVRRLTTQELDKLTATLRDRGVDVEALLDQADEIIEAEAAR